MEVLIAKDRLEIIMELLQRIKTKRILGDTAELGCYRGGTSKKIAEYLSNRTHWAIDTFTGMPAPDKDKDGDVMWKGMFSASMPKVEKYLERCKNVRIVQSFFPKYLPDEMYKVDYAFVHIDCDLYQGTYEGLNFFWPRMTPGGIIVCDDLYSRKTPGAMKAFKDYFGKDAPRIWCKVIPQGYIIK